MGPRLIPNAKYQILNIHCNESPRWLSNLYQKNSRVHLLLAPLRHRLVAWRNLASRDELHQAWGTTAANRRPALLQALATLVPDARDLKILSFGCSTGEELQDLRRYYPTATLLGTDLNRASLREAQTKAVACRAALFASTDEGLRQHGPFNLIVACSVFIRHPEDTLTDDLRAMYPLESFSKGVTRLFDNLVVGGHMLIHNANYRVMDTRLAPCLEVVRHDHVVQSSQVPLFESNGKKSTILRYEDQLFRRTQ